MGTMRFMSISNDPKVMTKIFSFDSSPGRAIGQALGAGIWDEDSYTPELKEQIGDESVYEIHMRRLAYEGSQQSPLEKVGMITYRPTF